MILDLDLTLKDETLEPFWSERSTELHKSLWLPHQTVSLEQDSVSSNVSSNYQVDESKFWKKTLIPKNLTPQTLLVSSQALSTLTTVKEQQKEEKIVVTRKIRIFPENENKYFQALHTYRLAYNMAVKYLNEGKEINGLRETIKQEIKDLYENDTHNESVYDVNLIYEAVRKCSNNFLAQLKKFKKTNKPFKFSFMSWKHSPKYFICLKLGEKGKIYPRQLGNVYYTEDIPEEAIGRNTIISYDNGEWYACTQKIITKRNIDLFTNKSIIALDPGVRTFITAFNDGQVNIYGEDFVKDKLLPLSIKLSSLQSKRDKISNLPDSYYKESNLRYYNKQLSKIRNRLKHLITDLHKRVAYDLVMSNDIILLPTFETSKMVMKKDSKRQLRRSTIRSLLNLNHYKFKLYIKYLANKYGKIVLDVNESYTSKTFEGKIFNIGSKKQFKSIDRIIDRDINGARNILLRFISKHQVY